MGSEALWRAAERLESLAGWATPGTWRNSQTTDGMRFSALVSDRRHPDRRPGGGWDYDAGYGGCLIGESLMAPDREYIAAMNPDVGIILARLLRAVASEDPVAVGYLARAIAEEMDRTHPPAPRLRVPEPESEQEA